MSEEEKPPPPRPGAQPSAPSASHYAAELPYAEELQVMLEGRYVVESFLGQGGMGAVYKGLQMPLKRPVAIKILAKRQASGGEDDFAFEERFKREAYAMAALTHPNIVQVYDCGDAGENFLFISMELVQGGDLSDAIRDGTVTPETALTLIQEISDGLQAAHERGLVHRDVKPANIFLTAQGHAKVADFGLAKKFDAESTFVTKTGLGMGTPDYAAPEQYEGVSDIDHRADIYALGVMFYQMLTGSLPRGMFKPPSQRVAVDARLDAVIGRTMEPDRNDRYQSVAEFKADIQEILRTWSVCDKAQPPPARTGVAPAHRARGPSAPRPGPVRQSTVPEVHAAPVQAQAGPPSKSRMGLVIGVVLAVVAVGAGLFFALNKSEPPVGSGSARAPDNSNPEVAPASTSTASTSPQEIPEPPPVIPTASPAAGDSTPQPPAPAPAVAAVPAPATPAPATPAPAMPSSTVPPPANPPSVPVPPSVAPPPVPPVPTDPLLAQWEAGFNANYEQKAQKPYLEGLARLNQRYVNTGITRARTTAQQKGLLDEVVALDAEAKSIQNNEPLPPVDLDSLPASLKQLRATYRTELARLEADRAKLAAPVFDQYLGALSAHAIALTKDNKIEQAQRAREVYEQVTAQKTALLGDASSSTTSPATGVAATTGQPKSSQPQTAAKPGTPIPIPPEALAPPKKAEHTRDLLEWMASVDGRATVLQGKVRTDYSPATTGVAVNPADFPKGPISLALLDSANFKLVPLDTSWLEGETDLEALSFWMGEFGSPLALRGMKKLATLRICGSTKVLPDDQMVFWPPLPALTTLHIQGAFGHKGMRILCERCPKLEDVFLQSFHFEEGALQPLQSLKGLKRFTMDSCVMPASELLVLNGLTKLELLSLGNMDSSGVAFSSMQDLTSLAIAVSNLRDEDLASLSALKKLVSLHLIGCKITDAALPKLSTLTKVESLDLSNNTITGSTLGSLAGLKSLMHLRIANAQLTDAGFAKLPPHASLRSISLDSNPALGDSAATVIAKCKGVTNLNLALTGLSDVGLQVICNGLRDLVNLALMQTKITDAGIPALKRLALLTDLNLDGTAITDASVEHFKKLPLLKSLSLNGTKVTPEGIATLRKALPQCRVVFQ